MSAIILLHQNTRYNLEVIDPQKKEESVKDQVVYMDSCPKTTCCDDSLSKKLGLHQNNVESKIPSVELPDDLFEEGLNPWKFSLIGRLYLQKIKFVDAAIILRQQWKLVRKCKLIPLGRGFFTIKLDNEVDRMTIKAGLWEVNNQVLQVRNWVSNFRPSSKRTSKAQVWVRLPGLGLEFWKEEFLFKICKEIGTLIKIDTATANCEVGYDANVLVQVDFSQSILNKIWIGTKFEGFFLQDITIPVCPKFCHNCKIIGHLTTECRVKQNKTKADNAGGDNGQKKFTTPAKHQQIPFDICNISEIAGEDSVVNIITETQVIKLTIGNNMLHKGKFSPLECEEGKIEEEVVIKEVPNVSTPKKVNNLENSTIKYVDGKTGQVSNEAVKVTSWSKIVEKEMVSNIASSSNATSPIDPVKSMVIHNSTSNNKGNIWLFWNKNISTPQVISVYSQMITVSIEDVLVSGVHAHVKKVQRRFLWSEMEIISELNKPWIALGDFNAVISKDEKMGGKSPNRASMLEFATCLDNCDLIQAPKTGL
ncbi:uncharacterized protein LOC113324764 [Papaver somniferum]|uniref:uncharacterized protein LOC113324764 n=1 Tax=Papaver somniferum TaxID=3469 RepID=UPI000E6FCC5A|nr:uncharacterized protein LOC113324764 [Papaver somniferum]